MTQQLPLVIAGPTGTGKSELAVRLALARGGEVVNYDSVQVYRGFDIGSAKPATAVRATVPHHLYDMVSPEDEFNAADFARVAQAVIGDIQSRGALPILAGGTFFYLRALLSGLPEMPPRDDAVRSRIRAIFARRRGAARLHRWLSRVDPVSASRIAAADRHRVERALEVWVTAGRPISSWQRPGEAMPGIATIIALRLPREELVARLDARVDAMFAGGLIEETRELLARHPRSARPFASIGYREAVAVIDGALPLDEAIAEVRRRTRAYAKRQMTWLRSERNVHWIDASDRESAFAAATRLTER